MAENKDLRILLGTVSVVGLAAFATPVWAQATDTLNVVATVGGECGVTGATLNFGNYTGAEKDVDVPISFSCTAPSNVTIQLSGGTTGDPSGRQMFNPGNSDFLNYGLFQNSGRTTLWGQLPNDSQSFTNTTGDTPTVLGRIPAEQTPLADTYTDTGLITLTTN